MQELNHFACLQEAGRTKSEVTPRDRDSARAPKLATDSEHCRITGPYLP